MTLPGSGQTAESSPVEIEQAIDRSPRDFRVNPTKLSGVLIALLLAFDADANRYAGIANKLQKLTAAEREAARKRLDEQFKPNFEEMQRFFSIPAKTLYPGARIGAVQATFKTRPFVPFSARYAVRGTQAVAARARGPGDVVADLPTGGGGVTGVFTLLARMWQDGTARLGWARCCCASRPGGTG